MPRWTEQQYAEYQAHTANTRRVFETATVPFALPNNEAGAFALGRMPAGQMNKTETAYAAHLAELQAAKLILWFRFEAIKLRLADNTFLTVDFAVLPESGVLEMREVKGFMRDDALVKLKVAASIYPFKFLLVRKRKGGGWDTTEI